MAENVIFKEGTSEQYAALEQHPTATLYWLSDKKEIRKGDDLYGVGRLATAEEAGLMSAEDKAKLDGLTAGTISGLAPVDASIIIEDDDSGGKTIGVQISDEPGNQAQIMDDGIYVPEIQVSDAPEFIIKKLDETTEGYSASYQLQRTAGESVTLVGDVINIPKDLVLQSGSLKEVTEADQPYAGAQVGDPYIDLVLNDTASSHIYIPVKGIVDTSEFVVREIVNSDGGKAIIENEPTGGGAKYHHPDGTESFVGVNDGGATGMVAQIYADKQVDGNWIGSRLNVYQKGMFYHNAEDKASSGYVADDPAHEIAVKGDIPDVSGLQAVINSMPDEIISELVNVQRTETTNTAELRIFTKTENGTYSPAVQHGVLTLIPAGQGPDGVNGAGLMTAADKAKLDSIDVEQIASMAESLTWGTI